jgi:hypothetical protein
VTSTSGSRDASAGRTVLAVILGIVAVLFLVAAIIYLAEPANSLPSVIPGHISGSTGHHPLRAIGSLVVAVAAAAAAWFTLAYKPKPRTDTQADAEGSPAERS